MNSIRPSLLLSIALVVTHVVSAQNKHTNNDTTLNNIIIIENPLPRKPATAMSHAHPLIGRWKVISMSNEELYVNFKNDSVSIVPGSSMTKDSMKAKEIASSLFQLMGEVIFLFTKEGKFSQTHEGKLDGIGTFSVDDKSSIINTNVNRNNDNMTETISYVITQNILYLTYIEDGDGNFTLGLEKTD
jgi:hypothetical protein